MKQHIKKLYEDLKVQVDRESPILYIITKRKRLSCEFLNNALGNFNNIIMQNLYNQLIIDLSDQITLKLIQIL